LDSLGRGSVLSVSIRSDLNNPGVNSASNAVLHFDIEFRDNIGLESSVFLKILFGGGINDVSDGEAFDSFVLGTKSTAVDTDDGLDESSVVFVSTVVSSFDGHVVGNYI
jgi:hypothetical protein